MGETYLTLFYAIHMLPFTYSRWLTSTGSACITYMAVMCDPFLLSGCTSYIEEMHMIWDKKSTSCVTVRNIHTVWVFKQIEYVWLTWFQAYATMQMRSVLFWDCPQRRMVIMYWRFSTTCLFFKGQAIFLFHIMNRNLRLQCYFTIYNVQQTAVGLLDQTDRGCWRFLNRKWNRSRVRSN